MSQKEDMTAIKKYMAGQKPKTSKATKIRDEFIKWYDNLSWYEENLDGDAYDKARNLRNEYNRADAVTDAQEAAAEKQIQGGATTEELEGGTTRQLSSGYYEEPLITDTQAVKLAGAAYVGGLVVVIGTAVVGAVYLLPHALNFFFPYSRYR